MRWLRIRWTVRRLMGLVAIVALGLGQIETVRLVTRAAHYQRRAAGCARMERRCRAIVAMDAETRRRAAEDAFDDPFLDNPEWSRQMISYFALLKQKYAAAATRPWVPIPPDPPNP